tara:strand:- start:1572 stop:1958 length:387 start_codon:yes stop_codon:yes gene_type:complete
MFELIKNKNNRDLFDNLFDNLMLKPCSIRDYKSNDSYFSTDEKYYKIDIALPGANKDEIQLSINNNFLDLKYTNKRDNNIWNSSFNRTIKLPNDILENKINAELKDGILSIKISRDVKKSISKIITIK